MGFTVTNTSRRPSKVANGGESSTYKKGNSSRLIPMTFRKRPKWHKRIGEIYRAILQDEKNERLDNGEKEERKNLQNVEYYEADDEDKENRYTSENMLMNQN